MKDIVILDGARTPMAEYNGAFADISAIDLAVLASREALARAEPTPPRSTTSSSATPSRPPATPSTGRATWRLKSGVPKEVPALTVNRLCGSGFESIVQASHRILLGEATTVLAGGMENMSQAPARHPRRPKGFQARPGPARGLAHGRPARHLHGPLHGADVRPRGGQVRDHAGGAGRVRSLLAAAGRGGVGGVPAVRGSRARRGAARARRPSASRRTTTCAPTRRSRGWRPCRLLSERAAWSRPATLRESWTGPPPWS